jgi:hypothetical protein
MSEPAQPHTSAQHSSTAALSAIDAVLAPLARLALARGVSYQTLQESLKRAVVQAALAQAPGDRVNGRISHISTATGINRPEVKRLLQPVDPDTRQPRSKASEVFAHWITSKVYRTSRGQPRVLPRTGPAPSFETLVGEVTRDVHPRSMLDELLRLGLVEFDLTKDRVRLGRDGFVPRGDEIRMLGFLSDNVSDHLSAAVENLLAGGSRHFEQALFADGLADESIVKVRQQIGPLWQRLLDSLVPQMQQMVEKDETLDESVQRRLRIGLYVYDDAEQPPEKSPSEQPDMPKRLTGSKRRGIR